MPAVKIKEQSVRVSRSLPDSTVFLLLENRAIHGRPATKPVKRPTKENQYGK